MATLEIEGRLKQKLDMQSGSSARGAWVRQDFVIEYQDGNYPAEACFSAWGQDRVDELGRFNVGDTVKVAFNIKAREYAGKWYNDLRVWRLSNLQQTSQQQAPQYAAVAPAYSAPVPPVNEVPAPGLDDMPSFSDEDMPF